MLNLFEIRNSLINGISIYDLPLKVTYYARVSTDKYEQLNSLENQVNYYEEFIKKNSKWIFVDGYIDEGISGTSVNKREAFKKMIRDAKDKKFNLIITKEISRFARDTLDSISYTRKLLESGVGVLFQYDHINTFSSDSELRLTIMASIAQEEVRKLSERVRFGFQRSIEKGSVLGNNYIWGYRKENCKLVIIEEEAKIIRKIFNMYVNEHIGMRTISNRLFNEGIRNKNGKPFTQSTIKYILTNPKYKGYYCGNRTRIIDYHSKERVNINKDDWKLYKDYDKVPPIVNETLWNMAQEIIKTKSSKFSKEKKVYQNRYPFSGKIFCMEHNTTYRRKINISSGKNKRKIVTWRCSEVLKYNKNMCDSPIFFDNDLTEIIGKIILYEFNKYNYIDELMKEYKKISDNININVKIKSKYEEIMELERKKSKLLELILDGVINNDEFNTQHIMLDDKINILNDELIMMNNNKSNKNDYLDNIREKISNKLEDINSYIDDLIWCFLNKIEVYKTNINDYYRLVVILNSKKKFSIYFDKKEHHFDIDDTYD